MLAKVDDTICALASPVGAGARAVIRLSGPRVIETLAQCLDEPSAATIRSSPRPRVYAARLRLPDWTGPIPLELYLWPGPRSFTGQAAAELHLPGSMPLADDVLARLTQCGARLAWPGEFTLRAFLSGRIDLTQAEAVLGVIDAQGDGEFRRALVQLAGGFSRPLAELRGRLLDLLADLEAGLDFVEEDISFLESDQLCRELAGARAQISALLGRLAERSLASDEPRVVLWGRPNAGKSSLFNRLVGGHEALVTPVAGTTRDYLTARWTLPGGTCLLCDTAGIDPPWETGGPPAVGDGGQRPGERLSVSTELDSPQAQAQLRTAAQAREAQLLLWCLDGSRPLDDWEMAELARRKDSSGANSPATAVEPPRIVVTCKADLPQMAPRVPEAILVSAASGRGLEELAQAVAAALERHPPADQALGSTAVRCRGALERAEQCLAQAEVEALGAAEEWVAAELRLALDELGQVTGAVYTEDLLDRIFSRFCIGK